MDMLFIQFAGFTVGRAQSFFDMYTFGGAYTAIPFVRHDAGRDSRLRSPPQPIGCELADRLLVCLNRTFIIRRGV